MLIRICFCSLCGSLAAILHLLTGLLLFVVSLVLLSFYKLQQLLFQLEKAAFSRFIMSVQDPTHPSGGKNWS